MFKFKTVYIVHGLILFLVIASLIFEVNKYIDYFNLTGNSDYIYYFKNSSIFRTTLFLSLPFIGVLFKKKIGWIFITQYFYFILFNAFLYSNSEEFDWIFVIILLLLLGLIIFMNHEKIHGYYGLNKGRLLGFNIIAFVIGFEFSLFLFIKKNTTTLFSY
jgi:hypothetical protein